MGEAKLAQESAEAERQKQLELYRLEREKEAERIRFEREAAIIEYEKRVD